MANIQAGSPDSYPNRDVVHKHSSNLITSFRFHIFEKNQNPPNMSHLPIR